MFISTCPAKRVQQMDVQTYTAIIGRDIEWYTRLRNQQTAVSIA